MLSGFSNMKIATFSKNQEKSAFTSTYSSLENKILAKAFKYLNYHIVPSSNGPYKLRNQLFVTVHKD